MNTDNTWRELYQGALLELRPEQLRQRIDVAEAAIRQRIVEIAQSDLSSEDERHALDDALRGLRILVNTECTPRLVVPGLMQNGASS